MTSFRRPSPSTLFRQKGKQGRLRRFRTAALNWLNGLPVKQDDLFDSASIKSELRSSAREQGRKSTSFGSKLNPRNWRRSKSASSLTPPGDTRACPLAEDAGKDNVLAEKVEEEQRQPQHSPQDKPESRPPVRIIQLPPEPTTRIISQLNKKDETQSALVPNEIHTAKYTVLNFLPKNILEQMRRVANVYFVFIVILQCFPAVRNYNPVFAAAPIVIILAVTAAKDAVEDWRRHQQDREVNYSVALTLNRPDAVGIVQRDTRYQRFISRFERLWDLFIFGCQRLYCTAMGKPLVREGRHRQLRELPEGVIDWKETFWRDLRVGDIVFLRNNEMIPADVLLLSTSEPEGVCFVETKNLDGETNLKIRRSPYELEWIKSPEEAYHLAATLEVDLPSSNLYAFNARIVIDKEVPSPLKEALDMLQSAEKDSMTSPEMIEAEYGGVGQIPSDLDLRKSMLMSRTDSAFVESTIIAVGSEGILLRGCIIRNTEFVIGVIVYTGPDTKLMLNSGGTPSKRTRIERQMNPQIILSFVLLFIICVSCATVQAHMASTSRSAPYLYASFQEGIFKSSAFLGFLTFWSSMILFQTLVPISMYVTVEIIKTIQAFFINNDIRMYFRPTNQRAVPRAWNLADDLGQIEYLFSDKTGTLTQNVMEFRKCSIGGVAYGNVFGEERPSFSISRNGSRRLAVQAPSGEENWSDMELSMIKALQGRLTYDYVPPSKFSFVDPSLYLHLEEDSEQQERIVNFFLLLVVCHTVLIDYEMTEMDNMKSALNLKPHNLIFKAQSPDEAALVSAARDLGFVFLGRDKDLIYVSMLGDFEAIAVLNVLEFSSDRKRMSTIVRRNDGRILLMCKGADNVIFERLSHESAESRIARQTSRHLELFAEDGLRTLCIAYKELSEREYGEWMRRYSEAATAMHNRELLMDAIADEIERDLTLLGATAIEDRLQEGVPECIETLQMAGVKIWVLTGDKMETAINIGFSCRLLNKNMVLLVIRGSSVEETTKQLKGAYERIWSRYFSFGDVSLEQMATGEVSYAMIIEGSTLKLALDPQCRKLFVNLSSRCSSVICCRVSPLQKAQVVTLIKRGKNVMTMAIGDGANDVSMIQAADVGVGIAGQEGMQAVMSSDYAIAQFRYLTRLLLVHGRWSYLRVAEVTLCSLYKNLAFVVLLYWYQFYCGFTAQYVYDYMFLLFFNMLLTIVPLLLLGGFDRDLTDDVLVRVAPIYRLGIEQRSYSMKLFGCYTVDALYQSAVCFFIPMLTYRDSIISYFGQPESQTLLGTVMAVSIITCTNTYALINTFSWYKVTYLGFAVTVLLLFGLVTVYSFLVGENLYGAYLMFIDPIFWCTIILSITVALSPRCLLKYLQTILRPTDLDIVREISKWHIHEAALLRSVQAKPGGDAQTGLIEGTEKIITEPPKAMVRVGPRRVLGVDLSEDRVEDPSVSRKVAFPPPILLRTKTRPKFLEKSLALFNLKTGRFEKMSGYAFSQEAGMGEIVGAGGRRLRKRPHAFGTIYVEGRPGEPGGGALPRASLADPLATPTMPSAVARPHPTPRKRQGHGLRRSSIAKMTRPSLSK